MPMNYVKIAGMIASEPQWFSDQCSVRIAFNETLKRTDQIVTLTANDHVSPELANFPLGARVLVTGCLFASTRRGVHIKVNAVERDYSAGEEK
jgi:hypothetical protein